MKKRVGKILRSHPKLTPALEKQFAREAKELSTAEAQALAREELRRLRLQRATAKLLQEMNEAKQTQGLSLTDLSSRTGMSRPALSRLLDGQNANPKLDTILRVCEALGKNMSLSFKD